MRYIERKTVTVRCERSLASFLFESPLAALVCHQQDSSPGALVLDHLQADHRPGELFEDWLVRQVRALLVQRVRTDDWEEGAGEWAGTRTQQELEGVQLSEEDRQWLLSRYGRHPAVLAVWEEALEREQPERAAA